MKSVYKRTLIPRIVPGLTAVFILLGLSLQARDFVCSSKMGTPEVRNFPLEIYSGGTQNWAGLAIDGKICFGNNEGLLIYDGAGWELLPVPNRTIVRSVTAGPENRLYVGAQGEVGFFTPDSKGSWVYSSLVNQIPEEARAFEDVWELVLKDGWLFFRASDNIYALPISDTAEDTRVWNTGGRIHFLGELESSVALHAEESGILKLDPVEGLSLAYSLPTEVKSPVTGFLETEDRVIISSLWSGLFYTRDGEVKPLRTEASSFLKEHGAYAGQVFRDGRIAVGTSARGLVILDGQQQEIEECYDRSAGLLNQNVLSLAEDVDGNCWLGLDNGIAMIAVSSAYRRFFPDADLRGAVYTMIVHKDRLYCGTNNGLYSMQQNPEGGSSAVDFEFVKGSKGQVWSLQVVRDELLMGHHEGAFRVVGDEAFRISGPVDTGVWVFRPLPSASGEVDRLIAGTYEGLQLYSWSEGWRFEEVLQGFGESSRFLAVEDDHIWIGHPYRGLWRAKIGGSGVEGLRTFGTENGLPSDNCLQVFSLGDRTVFTASHGIWRYDRNLDRFLRLNELDSVIDPSTAIRTVALGDEGDMWVVSENDIVRVGVKDSHLSRDIDIARINTLRGELVGGFEFIYDPSGSDVFFATDDGVVWYQHAEFSEEWAPYQVSIRKVQLLGLRDSLVFAGGGIPDTLSPYQFNHSSNAFRFSFVGPDFERQDLVRYSSYLEGEDQGWSDWSSLNFKEYTNLKSGNYHFRVKAMDVDGNEMQPASYAFRIAPAWYETSVAKVCYASLFIFWIASLMYLPRRRLAKERKQLSLEKDLVLEEMEARHLDAVATTERELDYLRTEVEQAELMRQQFELAVSTKHLVQKNTLIAGIREQIKEVVEKGAEAADEEGRWLEEILSRLEEDTHYEEDWDQFALCFDRVHTDFMARLSRNHSKLTEKDLKLCALLKMDLNTREIAPLLNISVRGVEIARYRLRKKLDLEGKENLTEFLDRV